MCSSAGAAEEHNEPNPFGVTPWCRYITDEGVQFLKAYRPAGGIMIPKGVPTGVVILQTSAVSIFLTRYAPWVGGYRIPYEVPRSPLGGGGGVENSLLKGVPPLVAL